VECAVQVSAFRPIMVPKQGSSYPAGRTPVVIRYASCKPRVPLIFQAIERSRQLEN